MPKTIEDLKALRQVLVKRRFEEACRLGGARDDADLERLVALHQALDALDAVIAEGVDVPSPKRTIMGSAKSRL